MKIQTLFISSLSLVCLLAGCKSESGEPSGLSQRAENVESAATERFQDAGDNLKRQGELVKQSYEKASADIKESAQSAGKEIKESAKSAGDTFSEKLDKPSDSKGIQRCRQAAENGDRKAQYTLGICYRDGNGVTKDLTLAKYWFEKSAKQGHAPAIQALKNLK